MKQKPMATYIKNGVEKTVILTKFNKRKVLNCLYKELGSSTEKYYRLNNDIEFVHFKHFSFADVHQITSSPNTLCILEDCTFVRQGWYRNEITFEGGSFELVEPIFRGGDVSISLSELESFTITNPQKIKNDCEIKICSLTEKIHSINIADHNNITKLNLCANNIRLTNHFNLEELKLDGENIFIGNSNMDTSLTMHPLAIFTKIAAGEEIYLTNCRILTDNISVTIPQLIIETPRLITQNASITAQRERDDATYIRINNNNYNIRKDDLATTSMDKTFLATNLISILKEYKQKIIDQDIKERKEFYMQESYEEARKKEEEIYQQLKELEAKQRDLNVQLWELKDNLSRKNRAIVKSLSKKPIKQLTQKEGK